MIPVLRLTKTLPPGQKLVSVGEMTYTIRQVQTADFAPGRVPLYITNPAALRTQPLSRLQREQMQIVAAGVVEPRLVPNGMGRARGREAGVTVEELFRDPEHAHDLFVEIVAHSVTPYRPGLMAILWVWLFKWKFSRAERAVKKMMRTVGEA